MLNPNRELCRIYSHPDAYFSEIYGHEKPNDTACVKIRTGYVVTFSDCTVLWKLKIHTDTDLSTMEAEIIDLAHNCR